MYKNKKEFSWLGLIIKLLILALFVFLVLWLLPISDKDDKKSYDKVFEKNIQNMMDSGKEYYNNHLPEKVNDKDKMTLSEMFANKIMSKFKDKEGNSCDTQNSYVQITKTSESEYALKALLSCDDQTDFLEDTIKTENKEDSTPNNEINEDVNKPSENDDKEETNNDTNKDNNSSTNVENNTTTTEKTETSYVTSKEIIQYEYKRVITSTEILSYCPEGYTEDGDKCILSTDEVIDATNNYSEKKTIETDAKENKNGTYKEYKNSIIKTASKTTYSCPAGFTANGSGNSLTCTKTVKASSIKTIGDITYSCPSGYTLSGSSCILKTSSTQTKTANAVSSNPTIGKYDYKGLVSNTNRVIYEYLSDEIVSDCTGSVCPGITRLYHYKTYTCPSGSTIEISNKKCYACPAGYTASGKGSATKCSKTVTTTDTKKITATPSYSCKSSDSKSGNYCYTCPAGYTQTGKASSITCTKTEVGKKITTTTSATYTCPTGYKSDSKTITSTTKCYKEIQKDSTYYCENADATLNGKKCYYTEESEFTGYSCPTGYKLENDKCLLTTTKKSEKTTTENNSETYTYTWSSEEYLEGWEKTGNTRTITVNGTSPNTGLFDGEFDAADVFLYSCVIMGLSYLAYVNVIAYRKKHNN